MVRLRRWTSMLDFSVSDEYQSHTVEKDVRTNQNVCLRLCNEDK